MSVIVVLIGFSIIVAAGFLVAFLWAVKSGQYDDDISPSIRILFDNEENKSEQTNKRKEIKVLFSYRNGF